MCCQHLFHYQMQAEHLNSGIDLLSKKELKLAKQCSQVCFAASSTAALINIRSKLGLKLTWTDEQIRYLNKKETNQKLKLSEDATTAENLINSFAARDDVNYLYVTYHPSEGLIMLTGVIIICYVLLPFTHSHYFNTNI